MELNVAKTNMLLKLMRGNVRNDQTMWESNSPLGKSANVHRRGMQRQFFQK